MGGCALANSKKNDLNKDNLNGKVKSVSETVYSTVLKFGEITKGALHYKAIFKYDDNGNRIEGSIYDSNGDFGSKYTFKYDGNGNQIERAEYDTNGNLKIKAIYKYDVNGNQTEKIRYDSNGIFGSKYTLKYESDKQNNYIKT